MDMDTAVIAAIATVFSTAIGAIAGVVTVYIRKKHNPSVMGKVQALSTSIQDLDTEVDDLKAKINTVLDNCDGVLDASKAIVTLKNELGVVSVEQRSLRVDLAKHQSDYNKHLVDATHGMSRLDILETEMRNLRKTVEDSAERSSLAETKLLAAINRIEDRDDKRMREFREDLAPRFQEVNTRVDAVNSKVGNLSGLIDLLVERRIKPRE